MKTLTLKSISLTTALIISALAIACDDTNGGSQASCGEELAGVTCQAADGTCSAQVCTGQTWECPADTTEVALVPGNCDGQNPSSECGEMPVGVTCQTSDRTCMAQQCVSGSWTCPADTTEVALVPANCDGTSGPSPSSDCSDMTLGVTCQTSERTCVAQQCVSGSWTCPADTTQVALVPANCDGTSS
jgi:hypothetical protein